MSTRKFEKHAAVYGMDLKNRHTHKGVDYCVAAGGPHFDLEEFPKGYYQTIFYIMKHDSDKFILAVPQQYDIGHDIDLPLNRREDARLNSCRACAEEFINAGLETGAIQGLIGGY